MNGAACWAPTGCPAALLMSPLMKEMLEAQMKEMMGTLLSLQSHQEEGGDLLLTKAAALQEKLSNMKEEYKDRVQLALSYLSPSK